MCHTCHKLFSTKSALNCHMIAHCKNNPDTCDLTDATLLQKNDLEVHGRKHIGGIRYKCGKCHKEFALKDHLHMHSKTHCIKRLYQSKSCKARFEQTDDLNVPVTSDLNGELRLKIVGIQNASVADSDSFLVKPFGCAVCGEIFQRETEFQEHCFRGCYYPVGDDIAELFSTLTPRFHWF